MMSRHDLVWLSDLGWQQLIDQLSGQRSSQLIVQPSMTATDDQLEAIKLWQNQDWPLVVRRADADIGVNTDQICLGLAMPPHPLTGEKRRIALRCAVTDIKQTTPALPLSSVIGAAPTVSKWGHSRTRCLRVSLGCRRSKRFDRPGKTSCHSASSPFAAPRFLT